jgi:hypothetical protein
MYAIRSKTTVAELIMRGDATKASMTFCTECSMGYFYLAVFAGEY